MIFETLDSKILFYYKFQNQKICKEREFTQQSETSDKTLQWFLIFRFLNFFPDKIDWHFKHACGLHSFSFRPFSSMIGKRSFLDRYRYNDDRFSRPILFSERFEELKFVTPYYGGRKLSTEMAHFWTSVAGSTTLFVWASDMLSHVWGRLFLKKLKIF